MLSLPVDLGDLHIHHHFFAPPPSVVLAGLPAVPVRLAALAIDKQVLVVTHLPQVAAFADAQVAIAKEDDGVTTVVRTERLTGDGRVRELARMLSGLAASESGQDHAEELLATAARERGR
jgi:DNA repair protein RecN (Recombination protein N)